MLPTADGVLVATVAPGVLYRWRDGRLDEIGRLGEGGIWDLAVFDGTVVAAAGSPAALFRLGTKGFQRWIELPDVHARCLEVAGDTLLVGTSGKGLILGVNRAGQMSMLTDSPFTEISDMAAADDGSVWAVALVGEPVEAHRQSQRKKERTPKTKTKRDGHHRNREPQPRSAQDQRQHGDLGAGATDSRRRPAERPPIHPAGGVGGRLGRLRESSSAPDSKVRCGVSSPTEEPGWRRVDAVQVVGIVGGGDILLAQGPAAVLERRSG